MKKTITFEFDVNDPNGAYRIAQEAINDAIASRPKRKWTNEEVKMAENIISDIMVEYARNPAKKPLTIYSESTSGETSAMYNLDIYSSNASSEDEYHPVIGTCVVLCKALGKPIPEFITKDNSEEPDDDVTLLDIFTMFFR